MRNMSSRATCRARRWAINCEYLLPPHAALIADTTGIPWVTRNISKSDILIKIEVNFKCFSRIWFDFLVCHFKRIIVSFCDSHRDYVYLYILYILAWQLSRGGAGAGLVARAVIYKNQNIIAAKS